MTAHADVPHVGLFNRWEDALAEANFRAALTGYRNHVRFDPNNRWWQITESGRLEWWHAARADSCN